MSASRDAVLPWSFYTTQVKKAAIVRFVIVFLLWVAAYIFASDWLAPVFYALLSIVTIAWIGFEAIPSWPHEVPLDDIGFWYILAVACYGALPLIIWLSLGGEWARLNDLRLFLSQPGPTMVATLGFYYALHLAIFVVTYLLCRGPSVTPAPVRVRNGNAARAFILWLCAAGVMWAINILYPFERTSYADSYLAVQQMPLAVRQIMRVAFEFKIVLALVVLAWTFSKPNSTRARLAYLWIGVLALMTFFRAGERTSLAMIILAAMILHHRQVRPKKPIWFALVFITGLLGFTALGWYRVYRGLDDPEAFSLGLSSGEFEGVFATAEDLWTKRRNDDINKGTTQNLLISELLAPIPSQLLPFEKKDYSDWYLRQYYPAIADRGGGVSFGVLSEAAVGWGVPDLIFRSIVTGVIFGALRFWYGRRWRSPIVTVAYLWCILFAYQSVRAGTLGALTTFVEFVPIALLLVFGGLRVRRPWRAVNAYPAVLQ
jgi:hypothetical protein